MPCVSIFSQQLSNFLSICGLGFDKDVLFSTVRSKLKVTEVIHKVKLSVNRLLHVWYMSLFKLQLFLLVTVAKN